jgi:hypothetical protein
LDKERFNFLAKKHCDLYTNLTLDEITELFDIIVNQEDHYQKLRSSFKSQTDSAARGWKQVIEYKKALKFYADERSYVTSIGNGVEIEATVMIDKGDMAREVLERELKNKTPKTKGNR